MGKGVLIVEDDADVRLVLEQLLRAEGYDVSTAAHGLDALEHLRASTELPGVILLDLWMPVMNGFEFREEQRKDPRLAAVPLVVISAAASETAKIAALDAVACFRKPLDMDELLRVVAKYAG